jgi:hypothetical protein
LQQVSSRATQYLNVAIAAVAASLIVVGLTLDTRTTPKQPQAQTGKPPVPSGLTGSVGKQIETAFRDWPKGSIDTMQRLGLQYEGGETATDKQTGAMVQYFRGVALLWAGYPSDAQSALVSARKLGTNTLIQSRADGLLHPTFFRPASGPWYPVFQPTSRSNKLLVQGSQLQSQGHQLSAEKLYDRAVKEQPGNVEALTAQAVGLFNDDNPALAFGKLGPLTQRFPKSQIVRYELAWLLIWTGQGQQGITQLRKAISLGANTEIGQTAAKIVSAIGAAQSTPSG